METSELRRLSPIQKHLDCQVKHLSNLIYGFDKASDVNKIKILCKIIVVIVYLAKVIEMFINLVNSIGEWFEGQMYFYKELIENINGIIPYNKQQKLLTA